jgi:hypothetical protein
MDIDLLVKWATIVNPVIGTVTLVILLWYTFETYKLRTTAQRQLMLPMMPVVLLRMELGMIAPNRNMAKEQSFTLAVRNVGVGPAFNVQIEPRSKGGIDVLFDRIPFLEPSDEKPIECQVEEEGKSKIVSSVDRLKTLIQNDEFDTVSDVVVSYIDAGGTSYRSIHKLKPGDFMFNLETVYQKHQEMRAARSLWQRLIERFTH